MKIIIIGGGNMGKTYAESFLAGRAISKENLYILEKDPERLAFLQSQGYHQVFRKPDSYLAEMDLLILAVKPQDSKELLPELNKYIQKETLILSIMAGIGIQSLKSVLPSAKIIRAMPNLPIQVGLGMTGFTADDSVSKEDLMLVQKLLDTTGKSIYFENEELINAVTAVSGSGPAYIFYFMEAMIQTAKSLGFSEEEAELLVKQTFMGAVQLFDVSEFTCKEWIAKVASKGGTTEAALKVFSENDLNKIIGRGLESANHRAVELGS